MCDILGGDGGPAVAALTGRSGAGKTTAAAAMVGERGPVRPRAGETEDQARTRLDRVRVLFPDGVVWLRVGRGEGVADRLPDLMLRLAKALREDVMKKTVDAPAVGEDGESYVKRIVSQKPLRCLVVADDVWEAEVVEKLRESGLWVLLTTRNASMVRDDERVVVDELSPAEAEDVLRGAARLSPGQHLCDDAMKVLEICGFVAMDVAFVGSWGSVRTADNSGVPRSNEAWADTVGQIEAKIDNVRAQAQSQVGKPGGLSDLNINRLAVRRAGFKYLGAADRIAEELYVALAVFPRGHAFEKADAAVLLNDKNPPAHHHLEVAMDAMALLERWAVLRKDASEKYRMHDAHVDFARGKLMGWEDVRKPAIRRWTSRISRIEFVLGIDIYALLDMWRKLERVGGDGWWASRPYDDQLVRMETSNRFKAHAVSVVAELYEQEQKLPGMETLMRKVLEDADDDGVEDDPSLKMTALCYLSRSLLIQGRLEDYEDVVRQLVGLVGIGLQQVHAPDGGASDAQLSTIFNAYGVCTEAAGRHDESEKWFRKALMAQEKGGLAASLQTVSTLLELGKSLRKAGRWGEAETVLEKALKIKESKMGGRLGAV